VDGKGYQSVWDCYAKKKNKRGRAKGDFIIGKRKRLGINREKLIKEKEEGIISTKITLNEKRMRIMSVYGEQGGKNI